MDDAELITVIDPAETPDGLSEAYLERLDNSEGFLVGGSDGVTEESTYRNGVDLKEAFPEKPIQQEPSHPGQVSKRNIELYDGVVVSAVLNGDREHFRGKQLNFFRKLNDEAHEMVPGMMPDLLSRYADSWVDRRIDKQLRENLVTQGFIILNPECTAAETCGVNEEDMWGEEEVKAAARAVEHFYEFDILYLEYSGELGDTETVEAASQALEDTHLRYGGGIENYSQVRQYLDAGADSVVAGTSFEEGKDPFDPSNA